MLGNILSDRLISEIEELPLTQADKKAQQIGLSDEIYYSKEIINSIREILKDVLSSKSYQYILREDLMVFKNKPIEQKIALESIAKKILEKNNIKKELEDKKYIPKNAIKIYLSKVSMDDNIIE